jgi:hypothetical protein
MANLADIRARLAAQDNKSSGNAGDGLVYTHWNIDDGSQAVVRFLPDADTNNPFFWVERQVIKLPFPGVVGGDQKEVIVQVPCMEMYGPNESCPVLAEVRPWFKDKSLEDMGRKYWKKRTAIFQGFVHTDPTNEDAPENPIRKFMISPSIFNIIKASLMDPEMEDLPTDYDNGLDFRIAKTTKGQYANYDTSTWSRKESALTEAELAAIETNGLNTLSDWLPKKPNDVELKVIFEMFEASVDGQQYDPEKWGQYYKPYGLEVKKPVNEVTPVADVSDVGDSPFETPAGATEVKTETVAAPVEAPASTSSKAEDILAQIRARQAG